MNARAAIDEHRITDDFPVHLVLNGRVLDFEPEPRDGGGRTKLDLVACVLHELIRVRRGGNFCCRGRGRTRRRISRRPGQLAAA